MSRYVIYKRVSTKKQQVSGLGLEAQDMYIEAVLKPEDEVCLSFTEAESGKKNKRPELLKAIQACRELKATLLVARLDRLSRNAAFLFTLRDSGIKILFADMPFADDFMIGIMAVVADWEGKRISSRIKDALGAKKERGESLGTIKNLHGRELGQQATHRQFVERVNSIKFALDYLIKQEKSDQEIITTIQGMYKGCPDSFVRRAIKYVKSLEETPTLAQ